jgi:hypothetical protein
VVIKCQETIDEYIPINYGGNSNVVVELKSSKPVQLKKNKLQKQTGSDKVIRRKGIMNYVLWDDYTGCCKPGEYDAELDAVVMIHYADSPALPKKGAKTAFTVSLPVLTSSKMEEYIPRVSKKKIPKRKLTN